MVRCASRIRQTVLLSFRTMKPEWKLIEFEAKLALDRFFATYAGLKQRMRTHARQCERTRRVTIGAGGVVENAWEGKYGLGYPQLCNLPVQGVCADCMMR